MILPLEVLLLVGFGGALGAIFRHVVTILVPSKKFPLGTFIINVIGSLLLGIIIFSNMPSTFIFLFGVGFCGSFTTFSTFSLDTIALIEDKNFSYAILNSVGTLIASLLSLLIVWIYFNMDLFIDAASKL